MHMSRSLQEILFVYSELQFPFISFSVLDDIDSIFSISVTIFTVIFCVHDGGFETLWIESGSYWISGHSFV